MNDKHEETKLKIFVCYFQPWKLPNKDVFFPIQSGKAISGFDLNIQGDDSGENISNKNTTFSEFTAWYWAWKNIKTLFPNIEYIGLAHYRRFFALDAHDDLRTIVHKKSIPKLENYENLITQILADNDIILAKQETYDFNLWEDYSKCHYISDLKCVKNIIHELCPEYDDSFFYFFVNNKISLYCMFIARFNFFEEYYKWLFPILFEAEKKIDFSSRDDYQKRALAFIAERLLNVYVLHHKMKVHYAPIYFIGKKIKISEIASIFKEIIKFFIPYGIIRCFRMLKIFIKTKKIPPYNHKGVIN